MRAARILMMDVDGVLVRGRPADGRHWSTDLRRDLGLDPGLLQNAFFNPYWHAIVTGRVALLPCLRRVLAEIAPSLECDALIDYWFRNDARLDKALLDALAALQAKGTRVHLATNQEHRRMAYLLDQLGLSDYFDGVHYSAALGCCKPERAFFAAVTRAVGVEAGSIVLADDAQVNVEAAQLSGWNALHWTGDGDIPALLKLVR